MTKGPLELRRTFPGVGMIRVSSGVHSRRTLRALEAMCRALYEAGRLDYLRLVRDRQLAPLVLYDRLRGRDFRDLPPPIIEPLAKAVQRFLAEADGSRAHKLMLKSFLSRLAQAAGPDATIEAVPPLLAALREEYRAKDQASAWNHGRNYARAFLRRVVGRRSPLYLDVADLEALPEHRKREPQPLSIAEAFGIAAKLGRELGDCWLTACLTGLGNTEYAGAWAVVDGHLRVPPRKRQTWPRFVPLIFTPVRPICTIRFLHERIVELTDGRVQFYDARRTFTKWLEQAGVIPAHQDFYTGHGPRTMTDHYKRGNVRTPQLSEDAGKLRAFVENGLQGAGLDAGELLKIGRVEIRERGESTRESASAPPWNRTKNLLIKRHHPKPAKKRKKKPQKAIAKGRSSRSAPESATVMRGRVRGRKKP